MAMFLRPNAGGHAMALTSGHQGRRAVSSGQAGGTVITHALPRSCLAPSASSAQREAGDELERPLLGIDQDFSKLDSK